ncbi:MAG: heavy metal-binding domain-containing protein [Actinomycetota bacterium]|nr:heavy metal-binding domain-containing protein [Actinomycetota bacterium]
MFTSDLTINEYLLVEDAGYEPLGLVLGTSIYHIGYQRQQLRRSHELKVLSSALYDARELAMRRMEEESADLGADGIVGVRLEVKGFGTRGHTAEFVAIGTAVRKRDRKTAAERPFTSDLSGQDFWTLLRTGSRPVGLVMGSCVYAVTYRGQWSAQYTFRNVELPLYTQALYDARELAMTRMQREAADLSAHGIVGVQLVEHDHGWGGRIVEFFAIGTAIVKDPEAERPEPPSPVINLSN